MACGIVRRADRTSIAQRPTEALLGGLWEFPGASVSAAKRSPRACAVQLRVSRAFACALGGRAGTLDHAYSHFRVTLHVFECALTSGTPRAIEAADVRWARVRDLGRYPMGKLDRQVARSLRRVGQEKRM